MTAPTRYPLAWPSHRPRTKSRRPGASTMTTGGKSRAVSLAVAVDRMEAEIDRLGGKYPLLSTNVEPRLDGTPRADRAPPADPGVCVYFQLKGESLALACDTFTTVAQNIAALANHIAAVRSIERYGVASAAETLRAFSALPAPDAKPTPRPWWAVLGFGGPGALEGLPAAARFGALSAAYTAAARSAHPDAGGTDAAMAEVNGARDEAQRILKAFP